MTVYVCETEQPSSVELSFTCDQIFCFSFGIMQEKYHLKGALPSRLVCFCHQV